MIFPPVSNGNVAYYRLVLRGCSQLCFQSNELTGLFFVAAVAVASPIAAVYFLVAAALAPAGRMLLGDRGPVLATGLPGLNPSLVALSLPTFFETGWTNVGMWCVLVVCVAIAVVLVRLFVAYFPYPILAIPFVLIFWGLNALAPHLEVLQPITFATSPPQAFHLFDAVLLSLGEAVFAGSIVSGLLFVAGVALSDWRHGVVAVLGAVISTLVAYYYRDVDPSGVNSGLYGFNGVLTAVCVYLLCGSHLRLALFGALVATILMPVFADLALPIVSAPFVFASWLIMILGWLDARVLAKPTSADGVEPGSATTDNDPDKKGD